MTMPKSPLTGGLTPLASALLALGLLSACAPVTQQVQVPTPSKIAFSPVAAPRSDADKRRIQASANAVINGQAVPIAYHTVLRTGDVAGSGTFGQLVDQQGVAILDKSGQPRLSNRNDFSSLHSVGRKLFMISHFEDAPGAMYLTELEQQAQTGKLSALNTRPLDFSKLRGGWKFCAGVITPWHTHLGGEEYDPDADKWNPSTGKLGDDFENMTAYFSGDALKAYPYDYGWMVEVKILNEAGDAQINKHYSMGRIAHELAYVMPDGKTVYLSDDGNNVGLFMFVADVAGDLSAGRLYAARWLQTSAEQGGSANLEWIDLGHASQTEISAAMEKRPTFQDIFAKVPPTAAGRCPTDYVSINSGGYKPHVDGGYHECLKLQPGMAQLASRLETRRYAAMLGATTEFNKMEGLSYDAADNSLYLSMSYLAKGMEDFKKANKADTQYDIGGPNHVRLPFNHCGAVYRLTLADNPQIGSAYVATQMTAFVTGTMTRALDPSSPVPAYPKDGDLAANHCDLNGLANPDNLSVIPGYRTLMITEDSDDGHENDAIWALNLDSKQLTRVQTGPYGSEMTAVYTIPNLNGFGYILSTVQHPFAENGADKLKNPADALGYTGYLGPFPAFQP